MTKLNKTKQLNDKILTIIGVYMTCMSSSIEKQIKFDSQLFLLKEKINSCRMENKKFIIIGELNGDIKRHIKYIIYIFI